MSDHPLFVNPLPRLKNFLKKKKPKGSTKHFTFGVGFKYRESEKFMKLDPLDIPDGITKEEAEAIVGDAYGPGIYHLSLIPDPPTHVRGDTISWYYTCHGRAWLNISRWDVRIKEQRANPWYKLDTSFDSPPSEDDIVAAVQSGGIFRVDAIMADTNLHRAGRKVAYYYLYDITDTPFSNILLAEISGANEEPFDVKLEKRVKEATVEKLDKALNIDEAPPNTLGDLATKMESIVESAAVMKLSKTMDSIQDLLEAALITPGSSPNNNNHTPSEPLSVGEALLMKLLGRGALVDRALNNAPPELILKLAEQNPEFFESPDLSDIGESLSNLFTGVQNSKSAGNNPNIEMTPDGLKRRI